MSRRKKSASFCAVAAADLPDGVASNAFVKEKKVQLTTTHALEYDKLGRLLHDRVTVLGSGVDGAVRRVTRSYEVRGMLAFLECASPS